MQQKILAQKKFRTKNLSTKIFFIQTVSEEMVLQQKNFSPKIFFIQIVSDDMILHKNIFERNVFHPKSFRGNDFATKNFRQKKIFHQNFLHPNCFRGNGFPIKNVLPKNSSTKMFFIQTVSEEMIMKQKHFRPKNFFFLIFSSKLSPRKWFCNKKYSPKKKNVDQKIFRLKFFHPNCFRGNSFTTKKNFRPTFFSTKLFPTI